MPGAPKNTDSQDPVKALAEILKDDGLDADDKRYLIEQAKTRFKHRRIIAYICLAGMFVVGAVDAIPNVDIDVAWINSTFALVVLAYYGVSAAKPNS